MSQDAQRLAHSVLGNTIRTLLDKLDEAARHINEMGCTCDGGAGGHHLKPCTGHDIAKEYWALTNRIRRRAGVQEKTRSAPRQQPAPTVTVKQLRRKGWILLGTVESDTDAGVEYEIKRSPDGQTGCACMGWAIRKTCKHVDAMHEGVALTRGDITAAVHVTYGGSSKPETLTVRRAVSFGPIGERR